MIAVDTNILVWGVREEPDPDRPDMVERCKKLISDLHDRNLERYLIKEKAFNPNRVGAFIRNLKSSLGYANLTEGDILEDTEDDIGEQIDEVRDPGRSLRLNPSKADIFKNTWLAATSTATPSMRDLPITLPSLAVAMIRLPIPMTEQDYNTLLKSLEDWKPALVKQMGTHKVDEGSSELEEDSELE